MQPGVATIEALLILFLMIGLWWVLRSRRVIMPAAMPALSVIALDVALPCLVFVVILKRFHPTNMPGWYRLPIGWVLFTLAALLLSLLAGYAARVSVRREFRLCCFYLGFLLLLQAAMPPVTAAPIMVERAGGNAAFASQLLLASYAASVVTIPAAVWLFAR